MHSAINKNDIDEFKKRLKYGDDITYQDEEDNNIIHLIAQHEKQKKNKYLDVVLSYAINTQTNDDFKKALNTENQNNLTPLQVALTTKVEKEKHSKEIPNGKDNTLIFIKKLIENGADTNQLKLPEKVLNTLPETKKEYYHKFLNELGSELIKFQPEKKDVIIRVIECIEHPLHSAIKKSDIDGFKKRLKYGDDITYQDEEDNNIIHLIAQHEKQKKNKYLDVVLSYAINTQTNDDFKKALNTENQNNLTPLQVALTTKVEKEKHSKEIPNGKDNTLIFIKKLIENGADTNQLKLPEKVLNTLPETKKEYYHKFLNELGSELIKFQPEKKDVIIRVIECIEHPLHSAIKKSDIDGFKKRLQDGYDITYQDEEGNNAIHRIALLKREQKVTCFNLILRLVEKGKISKEKLIETVNATNGEGKTPLKLVLEKKATKEPYHHLSQSKKIACDLTNHYDSTSKFCVLLLENGAHYNQLCLNDEELHTEKYYLVLRNLKKHLQISPEAREKANEIKLELKGKYHVETISEHVQHTAKKTASFMKKTSQTTGKALFSVVKHIDPVKRTRKLLATTITSAVVAMTVFAFFQGQITIGAALPIIATTVAICLVLTVGFDGIKDLITKLNKEQISQVSSEMNDISIDNNLQNSKAVIV